ncbi:hypothetical protein ACRRTK_004645 [Alexandromys fortis]
MFTANTNPPDVHITKTRFPMAQSLPLYIVTEAASECVRPYSVKLVKSNRIMIP